MLEAAPEPGGKLRRTEVGGAVVDVGAEAMLNRRPEGVALARELGLEVVHPAVQSSRIWTRGELRPLPRSVMGVPVDLRELRESGVLSEEGLARVEAERAGIAVDDDLSVGDLVASRLGDEVVDRLVEPLLGGVYAGQARRLSARATVPQLVTLASLGPLLDAELPASEVPVFAGLPGGLARLTETLAAKVSVRTGATVRELARTETGFALVVGPDDRPGADRGGRRRPRHPGRADRPAPGRRGARGRRRAGRDRVRLGGRGHAGVPHGRRTGARRLLRFPGAAGRRPRDQGLDVLVRQVGLGARGGRRARPGAPAHLAGQARRGGHAPAHRRRAGGGLARRPGRGRRDQVRLRSPRTSSGGAVGCRSTSSATSTGSRASAPRSPVCRGWWCAGRRTTAWGSPP